MDKEEFEDRIGAYLRTELDIEIEQTTEFGPYESLIVKVWLCGEVIAESSCTLPNNNY